MHNFIRFAGFSLIAITLFSSCGRKASSGSSADRGFDSVKATTELEIQNARFKDALSKSDSVRVAGLYTVDAKVLNQAMPTLVGRNAVLSFYGGMIRNGITGFSYSTTGLSGNDNNLIVEEGTVTFSFTNGKVAAKGRYVIIWKREEGVLKIFRDTYFSDAK